jgi:DNA N-6-adenine-methyltransferase (Dam)
MGLSSHQLPVRGETDEWLTPPHIIEALGPFDLDPCAAVQQPWRTAEQQLTIDDDGLRHRWHGFVWLNPPFGPEAARWLARLVRHGHGIGLVAARTETRWFVEQIWTSATAILFLHGRPYFHRPDGKRGMSNSGAPIALVGYGALAVDRLRNSGLKGSLVTNWHQT